jgi:hypothetical protein
MVEFSEKNILKTIKKIEGLSQERSKEMLFKIHENLVSSKSPNTTPVDTGFARNNWLASVGVPRRDTIKGTSTSLARVTGRDTEDKKLYLTNNVQYINALNNGRSKQQPIPGFIDRAVKEGVKSVKGE